LRRPQSLLKCGPWLRVVLVNNFELTIGDLDKEMLQIRQFREDAGYLSISCTRFVDKGSQDDVLDILLPLLVLVEQAAQVRNVWLASQEERAEEEWFREAMSFAAGAAKVHEVLPTRSGRTKPAFGVRE
jgi:hypothetical protein